MINSVKCRGLNRENRQWKRERGDTTEKFKGFFVLFFSFISQTRVVLTYFDNSYVVEHLHSPPGLSKGLIFPLSSFLPSPLQGFDSFPLSAVSFLSYPIFCHEPGFIPDNGGKKKKKKITSQLEHLALQSTSRRNLSHR